MHITLPMAGIPAWSFYSNAHAGTFLNRAGNTKKGEQ